MCSFSPAQEYDDDTYDDHTDDQSYHGGYDDDHGVSVQALPPRYVPCNKGVTVELILPIMSVRGWSPKRIKNIGIEMPKQNRQTVLDFRCVDHVSIFSLMYLRMMFMYRILWLFR